MARHANFRDRTRPTKRRAKAAPAQERRSATLLEVEPERTPDVVDELEREGVVAAGRRGAAEDEW